MSDLTKAIALAADVHSEQEDKGGEPYILHPLRVMQDAMNHEDGFEGVGIVAVLHDVLEDNKKYSTKHLRAIITETFDNDSPVNTFVPTTLDMLDLLTRHKGQDYLGEYIPAIKESETWAITIKLADLRDNLNILRQPSMEDRDLQRLQKYHMAYRMLS